MTYHVLKGEHESGSDAGPDESGGEVDMDVVVRSSLIYRVYRAVLAERA